MDDSPIVRRRDLRKQRQAQDAGVPASFSTEASPAAEDVQIVRATVADRPGFRGSDGSLVRRLKRRKRIGVASAGTVVVAGAALAAVVLTGGGLKEPETVTTVDRVAEAAKGADTITLKAEAVDAGSNEGSTAGGAVDRSGSIVGKSGSKAEAASRLVVKKTLPGCSGKVPAGQQVTNGQLPADWLCKIGVGGHKLRADAAVSFARMNAAYKKDTGKSMKITDSYRSLESQISVAQRKPGFAAKAGTSLHGWGIALDMAGGVPDKSGAQWDWLQKHAAEYGWENPDWAQRNSHEPWHWEYVPARKDIKGH
ncbi:M15 family metallopeptidase [Brevibacterium sp. 50QC2O2]|uniref:M15 family metallopeptidase n=1 Tax=Brevibacterium TaxID=1696 RepID=UPI00211BC833|nr:M15 family metallopeptidase [Brevibacterium sp. 91QC2O2]MCQ9384786.1 M15 family metallopeptidase [Brevibacterium sp. 68QC2CO]MCQ9387548.1 M15 family metallopeptidase [Brevibacterium sp. 50QC2O2]